MRLVFGPDDHEGYLAARERLQSLVVAWARRRGIPVHPALVAAALDHHHGVDGRLGRWTRAHVADALAVWFPRTVALLDDDREAVPVALHALIGFLAERDWLDTGSAPAAELHAQIDDSTPALHDALDDERNHDLGTFWAVQMLRHGVADRGPGGRRPLPRAGAPRRARRRPRRARRDDAPRQRGSRARHRSPDPGPGPRAAAGRRGTARAAADRRGAWCGCATVHPLGARRPAAHRRRPVAARRRPGRGGARSTSTHFSRDRARTGDDLPEISLLVALGAAGAAAAGRARAGWCRSRAPRHCSAGRSSCGSGRSWRSAGSASTSAAATCSGRRRCSGCALGEALPMLMLDALRRRRGSDPGRAVPPPGARRGQRAVGCVVDDLAGDVEQRLWRRDVTAVVDALELLGAVHLSESHDDDDAMTELVELAGRDDPDPTLVALTPIGLWARPRDAGRAGGARAARRASSPTRTSSTSACGWPGCAARSPRPS